MSRETKRDAIYLVLGLLVAGSCIWYYASLKHYELMILRFSVVALLIIGLFLYRMIKRR